MKDLNTVIRLIIKTEMAYKANFVFHLALVALAQITRLFYIDSIFKHQPSFGQWTEREAILSFILSVSVLFGMESFIHSIGAFCRKVYLGQIDAFLCKPMSLNFLFFFRGARFVSLFFSVATFLFALFYYNHFSLPTISSSGILYCITIGVSVVGVIFANVLLFAVASLSVFWLSRLIPVSYIFNQLFKLNLVPGSVYSQGVFPFLVLLIPSLVSSAALVSVICFQQYSVLIYLFSCCCFFGILFNSLFRMALDHSPSHGG